MRDLSKISILANDLDTILILIDDLPAISPLVEARDYVKQARNWLGVGAAAIEEALQANSEEGHAAVNNRQWDDGGSHE